MKNSSNTVKNVSHFQVHNLKTWPGPFERVRTKVKKADFRKDDREYKVGDILNLREYDPGLQAYTGRTLVRIVTDIANGHGNPFGIPEGYVMMSLREPTAQDLRNIPCDTLLS